MAHQGLMNTRTYHTRQCTAVSRSSQEKFFLDDLCTFSDSMNTAQRMEASSRPGAIHISATTHVLLADEEGWEATGGVEVRTWLACSSRDEVIIQPTCD